MPLFSYRGRSETSCCSTCLGSLPQLPSPLVSSSLSDPVQKPPHPAVRPALGLISKPHTVHKEQGSKNCRCSKHTHTQHCWYRLLKTGCRVVISTRAADCLNSSSRVSPWPSPQTLPVKQAGTAGLLLGSSQRRMPPWEQRGRFQEVLLPPFMGIGSLEAGN